MSPPDDLGLDPQAIKSQFPLFANQPSDKPFVYLDSASSSQKPRRVLDAIKKYYETTHANVHRGVYEIAERATADFENARAKVAQFVNAPSSSEIIYTRNATEALNLVAFSWGRKFLNPGDAIVLTEMEHHANIVPWQILAEEKALEIRWLPIDDGYQLDLNRFDELISGAKVLGLASMSNVLGTINPVKELTSRAKEAGLTVVVDSCQFTPQAPTDVQTWGADFVAFSAHKMMGPTGIGALWGRKELLEEMPPFLGGGEMIEHVTKEGFTTNQVPWKFEAGTPAIGESQGYGEAVDFLTEIGMENVLAHDQKLATYAIDALEDRFGEGIKIFAPNNSERRGGVVSFAMKDIHPHDVSQFLDNEGVCVRAGHHCAKPLMKVLDVPATSRASFSIYNDEADVDALVKGLAKVEDFFKI